MRLDYGKEKMQAVEVRGIRCEFNDMRIDRNTVPEGKFQYEVAGCSDWKSEQMAQHSKIWKLTKKIPSRKVLKSIES